MPQTTDPLIAQFARSRPDELAGVLAGADLPALAELIVSLPPAVAAPVVTRLPSWQLTSLLSELDSAPTCALLVAASQDDAVALVSHLSAARYPAVLEACPGDRRDELRQLFDFPSHSLASLAATRFVRVAATMSCGEFARQMSASGDTRPRPVLVVDEQNRYQGMLALEAAFALKNHDRSVAEALTPVAPLSGLTSADTALGSRRWTRYNYLPVVDARHRLLGVVNRAALLRVAVDASAAEFTPERLFSELATGYLTTCGRLLEALLGRVR